MLVQIPLYLLVFVQEPLCFQVQIPCVVGTDSKVFVGVGVGLASFLEQKSLCLLVQIPQFFFGVGAGALVFSGADSMYDWCRFHGVWWFWCRSPCVVGCRFHVCWCRFYGICWHQCRFDFFVGAESFLYAGVDSKVFVGVHASST